MNSPPMGISRADGVATISLNRPEVGNAINLDLAHALLDAAIECDEDPQVRCVVLTGTGRLFCAGGDVASFGEAGDRLPVLLKQLTAQVHAAISKLARMQKPLLTVVNGPAAGAGFSLSILGDVVLAARSAHFTMAYTALGLSPDSGATWLLPKLVGLRRAQELILTNRRVSAEEAAGIGLITRVVEDGDLAAETATTTAALARSATAALGVSRNLLLQSYQTGLESQMESEIQVMAQTSRGDHGREGVSAFLSKRKPEFR